MVTPPVFTLFSFGYSWPLEAMETFDSLLTIYSNVHLGFKTGSNHPITDEKKCPMPNFNQHYVKTRANAMHCLSVFSHI